MTEATAIEGTTSAPQAAVNLGLCMLAEDDVTGATKVLDTVLRRVARV